MREEVMLELAAASPRTLEDLNRMRRVTSSLTEGEGAKTILALIEKAHSLPLEDCPQTKKDGSSSQGSTALVEMLRLLLKIKAEKYHVAPKLIATSADLEEIARSSRPDVPALQGWRREVFGNAALALKEGKVAIGIQDHRISLISLG